MDRKTDEFGEFRSDRRVIAAEPRRAERVRFGEMIDGYWGRDSRSSSLDEPISIVYISLLRSLWWPIDGLF